MYLRPCVAITFAVLAVCTFSASAQAPAAPPVTPAIPQNTCVKPDFPGRLASSAKISAFNKAYPAYRDCVNQYIDTTKKIANDAVAAGNAAIDEFNKFAQEVREQSDANN